jgi:hypothetical protein
MFVIDGVINQGEYQMNTNSPTTYCATHFHNHIENGVTTLLEEKRTGEFIGSTTKRWVPVRPLGWQGLFLKRRLKAAWAVFTGRADVLTWEA